MEKKASKPKKVNDVAKPGETPAPSNARPTITGHQPMIKTDPMVAGAEDSDEEKVTVSVLTKPKTISPIETGSKEDETPEDDKESNEPSVIDESAVEKAEEKNQEPETKSEPEPEPEPEKEAPKDEQEKEDIKSDVSASSSSAAINELAKNTNAMSAAEKQMEEDKKRRQLAEQIAKEGKYTLPIIEGGHKASSQRLMSWLLLVLILLSAAAYLAADAGYINIGINLPYDFIKN